MLAAHHAAGQGDTGSGARGQAVMLTLDGAVGPATADYLVRGMEAAAEQNAAIVILQMDTPGGLDTSMRDIIRAILASPVPVASFVAPSGSRAASAGTYIMYASHIAAMAPGTNLGAATPVQLGGGGLPFGGGQDDKDKEQDKDGADEEGKNQQQAPKNASEAKAINDAVAYIRSLAELRGRNADWGESAVREAKSLSASAAAEQNVIDFVAADVTALLAAADGRTVKVRGNDITLDTEGLAVERIDPDWRTELLAVITNPNVALILMMIGVYGLIFEFINPGSLYPGTIGAISLLIGLYALAALPLNYAGAGLMLLGVALMVAEAFAPSFGILGIGGVVAFAIGAAILVDTEQPEFAVSWPLIGGVAVASGLFFAVVVPMAIGAHRRKVVSGREDVIGATGEVRDWSGGKGHVFVRSERWNAVSDTKLKKGDRIRVTALDGLTLTVEPAPAD